MIERDSVVESTRLRARLDRLISPDAAAIDVVITANEINDRHGTGLLIKRIVDGNNSFSIRSRNDWGVHDFGRWSAIVTQRGATRTESIRNVERVLAGRSIGTVLCVPYLQDEVATAIAIQASVGGKLCTYVMDDQNVAVGAITDESMRELLEKSSIRFATHPELRAAYEKKYGLKFFLLPAVVPDALIAPEVRAPVTMKSGSMIGSVWHQSWLDQLCESVEGGGRRIDWFGNNRFWSVDFEEGKLSRAGIVAHGVIPESELATELRKYPFAMVPVAPDGNVNRGELSLSLPGRILFTIAVSQTPVLIVGSEQSCAARFVRHFGIGAVAPYEARKIGEAMERLCDPAAQSQMRMRAATMGPAFTDRGVKEWLRASIAAGEPADSRFEDAFAGYTG